MSSRKRPPFKFKPIPTDLRRGRRIAPDYANFYGSYITKDGRVKRFSFKVKVDPSKPHAVMYKLIRHTCNLLKRCLIPKVSNGAIFDDFGDCLHAVDWMRVRKVRFYKAGMQYEK
jgi:hypothetical protein